MKFQIHLHGHIHDQWFTDSHQHLEVAAGSCYQGAEKENAYAWITIDFDQKTSDIYLRRFEEKGDSGWVPYIIPGKTNEEGVGHIQHLFARKEDEIESRDDSNIITSKDVSFLVPSLPHYSDLRTIEEFIRILQDRFSFRWEPNNFSQSNDTVTVYWPVRLRQPTPIHAIQCYVAAGLQRLGAKVVLFLDDFGNKEATKEEFCVAIKRWLHKVDGLYSNIDVRLCSETISSSDDVWNLLQTWFANSQVEMREVLLVSKLIRGEEDGTLSIQELAARKPRRLMTPAIVWACLASIYKENKRSRFLTLGGYDESKLWWVWRHRVNQIRDVAFGHLYIPELFTPESSQSKPFSMSENNLKLDWDAEEDIRGVFKQEVEKTKSLGILSPNRIIPWCFSGCFLLPSFLAGKDAALFVDNLKISSIDELKKVQDIIKLIDPLARNVSEWIL